MNFKERNVVKKDWRKVELKVALCYPNIYRVGMSGFTIQLLYALLNSKEDVVCERFFLPLKGEPILSLESRQPLSKFDVIAFTFQFEEDYFNALKMLLDSGIEVLKWKRKFKPLIVAGGPCITENPFPLKNFVDLFVVGEVEPILDFFVEGLKQTLKEKSLNVFEGKNGFFHTEALKARRVYVEKLDEAPHPLAEVLPEVDSKSPYMPIFGKTFMVEVVRGCPQRCKFCLITHIGWPMRSRSLWKVEEIIFEGLRFTGVGKVTLIGAGLAYYPKLEDLCEYIVSLEGGHAEISVPSLAVDNVSEKLFRCIVKGKQRTVTFAPETGCWQLRKSLGKIFNDEEVVEAAKLAFKAGVKNVKLYFMVGVPNETFDDLDEIVNLAKKVADVGFGFRGVRLSINPFIPKPHTPLQLYKVKSLEYLEKCYKRIISSLKGDKRFAFETLNPKHAQIQAALSIGDERLGEVLLETVKHGGGLAGWSKALKILGFKLENLLEVGEKPVWSVIQV
ncbi:MAG: B12-binding domain-containing radical SAM protein [Candidatus Bathyarchaeota archaeon]|nr:B12-binding domain-containing radical SAM protein [Candidatus Bathyarchaeota archaeon]